jgi:heptosyltransferase-2
MALPALAGAGPADVLVVSHLAPLLALAGLNGEIVPFERGIGGFAGVVGTLRERRYARGVLLTPSFSSALMLRLGRVRSRRGLDTDRRRVLLTDVVPRERIRGVHRTGAYRLIASGVEDDTDIAATVSITPDLRERWWKLAGPRRSPTVGMFPGGNASSRRWEPARFAEVARQLAADGVRVIVFGGPDERALTRTVAGSVALDAGGRTDLPLLAAGLGGCDILLTNDSGPMHLAAAVGTPTVSLWGAGDPNETAPNGPHHRLLRRTDLPCVPCRKNECPRTGAGYLLPNARRECLQLIAVREVYQAVAPGARPT